MTRRAVVAPQWRQRLLAAGLSSLDELLARQPDTRRLTGRWEALVKPGLGGRERWRWVLRDGHAAEVVYLKRYRRTPLREQLDRMRRQSARHSRAWWEYLQAGRLAAAQIPVPQAVACVEQMRGTFERRSAVLLAPVAGEPCDAAWARARARNAPITRGAARHELVVRLGRFIAAFHGTGFCHRDLYLCHLFVDLDPEGARPPRFWLIDLARTHRPRWRRMRWIIKDLSQLDASARQVGASRSDRLRFLLAYLGLLPGAARTRWYARRILRRSDRILARSARHAASNPPAED